MEVTDQALLERWREGDLAAGRDLFARHFEAVYRFFRNKLPAAAEDLTQQTFMACVQGRDVFRGDSSFRTYLFTIARRRLYTFLRDHEKRPSGEVELASMEDFGFTSPSTALELREEQRLLLRGLRRLPVDQQLALELHYWENLNVQEIANVLEVPVSTVKSRITRARTRLDAIMAELAGSETLFRSTIDDFERWARGLQRILGPRPSEGSSGSSGPSDGPSGTSS